MIGLCVCACLWRALPKSIELDCRILLASIWEWQEAASSIEQRTHDNTTTRQHGPHARDVIDVMSHAGTAEHY